METPGCNRNNYSASHPSYKTHQAAQSFKVITAHFELKHQERRIQSHPLGKCNAAGIQPAQQQARTTSLPDFYEDPTA